MILKDGTPWGFISGKLKFDPEVAKELFGFDMRPDEEFIVFRVRKGKQEVCHAPQFPGGKPSCYLIQSQRTVTLLSRIVKHRVIYQIWKKLAEGSFMSPQIFFIKENLSRVMKLGWTTLIIAKGKLTPPKIMSCESAVINRKMTIFLRAVHGDKLPIHIIVLNRKDFTVEHFTPEGKLAQVRSLSKDKRWVSYTLQLPEEKKWSHPVVYVFHKGEEELSSSAGVEAKSIYRKRRWSWQRRGATELNIGARLSG